LRNHGITTPVLVLGPVLPEEAPLVARYSLTATVCARPVIDALAWEGRRLKEPVRVHLKVDTGMGRYGAWHAEALRYARYARRSPGVLLEGMYTHLSCAEEDRAFTQRQLALFRQVVADLERAGMRVPLKHVANSVGLIRYPEAQWDMVRVGLALYGVSPTGKVAPAIPLRPALSWQARAMFVKEVPPGRTISYGGTYRTRRKTRIATIPVGYAHGYGRDLSHRAFVIVRGARVPVVGRVTMDHLMVDVGKAPSVRVGDPVTLLGVERGASVTACDLARWARTIPYEVLCRIGVAIPRRYRRATPFSIDGSVR